MGIEIETILLLVLITQVKQQNIKNKSSEYSPSLHLSFY